MRVRASLGLLSSDRAQRAIAGVGADGGWILDATVPGSVRSRSSAVILLRCASWKRPAAASAARIAITIEPALELRPKIRETSHAAPPITAAAGIVNTQAVAICPATPHLTLASFLPTPEPITPPETTWVVDSG